MPPPMLVSVEQSAKWKFPFTLVPLTTLARNLAVSVPPRLGTHWMTAATNGPPALTPAMLTEPELGQPLAS